MGDFSENMEVSPTRQELKLPPARNGYLSPAYVFARRTFAQPKEFLQRTLPDEHTSHDQEKGGNAEEINLKVPPPELKTNSKGNKKKLCKKRKNKGKESTEEFIFPKKTARPDSIYSRLQVK
ncbi:hypothetical protein TNCV_3653501 [Trichonephila clavipes]|nr:hypothetical protein TNCV_3653501 [Trichonephila clavipes]